MKRVTLALLLVVAVTLLGSVASADTVSFSTSGSFGSGSSSVVGNVTTVTYVNGIQVRYTSSSDTVNVSALFPIAGVSLGTFAVATNGSANLAAQPFTMTINQTSPTSGNGAFSVTISGSFAVSSGLGVVHFNPNAITVGTVTYSLNNGNGNVQLNVAGSPAGTFGKDASVEAQVSAVPEPASLALLGSGLMIGGNFVRRKLGV